jgi:hypothetical protein
MGSLSQGADRVHVVPHQHGTLSFAIYCSGAGAMTMQQGGAAVVTARRGEVENVVVGHARPQAVMH